MNCLKCGKETGDARIFCDHCLEGMDSCPVKPGTPIHLPHRPQAAPVKRPTHRKKPTKPEEQLQHLKRSVHQLMVTSAVLLLALCLSVGLLVHHLTKTPEVLPYGRNYTIDTGAPD